MPSCGIRCKSARYREQMTRDLKKEAIIKFASGVILIGLLLFLPAGTLHYPNGWLLIGVLFIPMLLMGAVMGWSGRFPAGKMVLVMTPFFICRSGG